MSKLCNAKFLQIDEQTSDPFVSYWIRCSSLACGGCKGYHASRYAQSKHHLVTLNIPEGPELSEQVVRELYVFPF